MITIDESIDVAASPTTVYGVITRLDRYPAWIPGVESAEPLPGPATGTAGSRFRLRFAGPMGPLEADGEVTAADPPRSVAIGATGSLFRLSAACDVEAGAGGTRLHVAAKVELSGVARFLEGQVRSRATAAMPEALENLKAAIEAEAQA